MDWYRGHAAHLVDVLSGTPADAPVWSFGPKPRTAAFWRRRQAHETGIHLWDAWLSQGQDLPIEPGRALDGVDEVRTVFFPRQVRLGRIAPLQHTLALRASSTSDGPHERRDALDGGEPAPATVVFSGDGSAGAGDQGEPDAIVDGPPDALLLLVWKRIELDDARLRITGDPAVAKTVLSQALTP